jgi:predicted nuclease of predicted toxin-antitoxin system
MKLLFDQNISFRILKKLSDSFPGSIHIKNEGLINASDLDIWEFAKNNKFTIVSQDSDFNDINLIKGFPPKIIWIKTGNLNTEEITILLLKHQMEIEEFLVDENLGCFEIFNFDY